MNLLAQRRFAPLFWTQSFGAFNDNFLKNALIILITFKASEVLGIPAGEMVSVAAGIFILPFFLFSATAGQLADKYEKGRMIRVIKVLEIGIAALAAYGFIRNDFTFLLVVLFLMGLHSTFFGPLKFSILPQHLGEHDLVGANALIEAGTFLSILLGTIAGGVLAAIPGQGPVYVSTVLMGIAVLGWASSLFIPKAPAVDPGLQVHWNPITPTLETLRDTSKNRSVFLSVLGISWFWFFGAAMLSLFPSYCKDVIGSDESVVTLFLGCFSVGIAAGSMLCERFSRRSLELGLVPLGSIGMTLFAGDLAFSGGAERFHAILAPGSGAWEFVRTGVGLRIVFDLLMLSVFSGFFIVPLYTLTQERSDPSHRSRVIAGNNVLNALFMVMSAALLVGLFKLGLSIPQIFGVLAVLNGLVAIYIYSLLPEFMLRFVLWCVANIMYRLKVKGAENVPDRGAALLVCNHVSFVDWLIIGGAIHRPVRFVIDHAYARGWIGRLLMKWGKVIPIAPGNENLGVLKSAFDKIAQELENGELVCVFPEGFITRDGNLAAFRPGVERILERSPVPVHPLALQGMWGSFFSRKYGSAMSSFPRRFWSRVTLSIAGPVSAREATAPKLREQVEKLLV